MSKGGVRLHPQVAYYVNVVVARELSKRQRGEAPRTGTVLYHHIITMIELENQSGDWRARLSAPCRATLYNRLRAAERLIARGVPFVVRPPTQDDWDEWDRRHKRRLCRRRIVRARLGAKAPAADRSTTSRADA